MVKRKKKKKRDYKREYRLFHGKPKQIRLRNMRGKARKKLGLKKGDKRECDHIVPLSKGGSNARSNLRTTTQRKNRSKGAKLKS